MAVSYVFSVFSLSFSCVFVVVVVVVSDLRLTVLKYILLYPYSVFLCTVRMFLSRVYTPPCQSMFLCIGNPV